MSACYCWSFCVYIIQSHFVCEFRLWLLHFYVFIATPIYKVVYKLSPILINTIALNFFFVSSLFSFTFIDLHLLHIRIYFSKHVCVVDLVFIFRVIWRYKKTHNIQIILFEIINAWAIRNALIYHQYLEEKKECEKWRMKCKQKRCVSWDARNVRTYIHKKNRWIASDFIFRAVKSIDL